MMENDEKLLIKALQTLGIEPSKLVGNTVCISWLEQICEEHNKSGCSIVAYSRFIYTKCLLVDCEITYDGVSCNFILEGIDKQTPFQFSLKTKEGRTAQITAFPVQITANVYIDGESIEQLCYVDFLSNPDDDIETYAWKVEFKLKPV